MPGKAATAKARHDAGASGDVCAKDVGKAVGEVVGDGAVEEAAGPAYLAKRAPQQIEVDAAMKPVAS